MVSRAVLMIPAFAAVELLHTPQGERHPDCVVEVPESSLMKVVDGGIELHHDDGSMQHIATPEHCHSDSVALKLAGAPQKPRAWIDEASYTYNAGIDKMTGYNNIPDAPAQAPGTDYWFLGMQNNEGGPVNIVQPVLTYSGNEWTAASWICCPSNITTTGPTIGPFKEGDRMYGAMTRVSSTTWKVDTVINGQTSSLTGQVGPYKYNWAVATFEDYGVSQCSQLPKQAVIFDTIELYDSSNNIIHPTWGVSGGTMCNGHTECPDENTCSIQHGNAPTPKPTPRPTPVPVPSPTPTPAPTPLSGAEVSCFFGLNDTLSGKFNQKDLWQLNTDFGKEVKINLHPFVKGSIANYTCIDEASPCVMEETSMCATAVAQTHDQQSKYPGQDAAIAWHLCVAIHGDVNEDSCYTAAKINKTEVAECLETPNHLQILLLEHLVATKDVGAPPFVKVDGSAGVPSYEYIAKDLCSKHPSLTHCAPPPTPVPVPVPTPVPVPSPRPSGCHSIDARATDDWCIQNCAMGFCPSDMCECDYKIMSV